MPEGQHRGMVEAYRVLTAVGKLYHLYNADRLATLSGLVTAEGQKAIEALMDAYERWPVAQAAVRAVIAARAVDPKHWKKE